MNEKGATTKAVSTNERLRIAKDKTCVQPFIIAPASRNRYVLTFKCKIFVWYNFCAHSVAGACGLSIWFDYFLEARKKHRNKVANKRGLSATTESELSAKKKGMKKY